MKHSNPSQEIQLMWHLMKGHHVTPMEALHKFGCFRLGARMYNIKRRLDLEDSNVCVKDGWVRMGSKRYKEYWLEERS